MSNEELATGTVGGSRRRLPRQGIGGSPVGSTLSIVLALVAVVLGYLILRELTEDTSTGAGGIDGIPGVSTPDPDTSIDPGLSTPETSTTTTTIPFVTEGATVIVANGNNVGGSAGRMSEALGAAGFVMGDPVNAASTVDESIVYFDPTVTASQDVADSVARSLGGVDVLTMPTPPPTADGALDDGSVLLVLGNNEVDRPLDTPATATLGTPALVEAPVVAGSEDDAETDG